MMTRIALVAVEMHAIYLRSLLLVFGLIAFVLIEALIAPPTGPAAPKADLGRAGDAA